ncbi:MAG: hypothetical protein RIC56_16550 [Pseudomonadales bacterium]
MSRWQPCAVLIVGCGLGAAVAAAPTPDPLFETREPLTVRLSVPLRALSRDRSSAPEYRPGQFALVADDGAERVFDITVRPRGRSRRDKEVCTVPPLRLNFRKPDLDGTVLDGQDKLKLVTHCRPSPHHQRFVYREYLAYRLLNTLTDSSFRVRPLQVTYLDSERNARPVERFGFFIEDKNRLARRLGLEAFEDGGTRIARGQLEPEQATLMELFQFLIGNTDFSFIAGAPDDDCCHNAVLLTAEDGRYAPFPYDFDITGFVNPPYAVVDYQLPLRNVRQRLFRGFCRDPGTLDRALARFRAARGEMLDVLATETDLDERNRGDLRGYVEEFFTIIDDPDARRRKIEDACRD